MKLDAAATRHLTNKNEIEKANLCGFNEFNDYSFWDKKMSEF